MFYCFFNFVTNPLLPPNLQNDNRHNQQRPNKFNATLRDAPLVRAAEINVVVYNHHQHDYWSATCGQLHDVALRNIKITIESVFFLD